MTSADRAAKPRSPKPVQPPDSCPLLLRLLALGSLLLLWGCHTHPPRSDLALAPIEGLSPPEFMSPLQAIPRPPVGWTMDEPKYTSRHYHQVWLSPSRQTAYGVILARMPLPVGPELALWGFLHEMRKSEGEAILLAKTPEPDLPGLRFEAEGGRYRLRATLQTHAFSAWVVYAGTLRACPEVPEELELAQRAREATLVAVDQ